MSFRQVGTVVYLVVFKFDAGRLDDHGGMLLAILALLLHVPDESSHWTNPGNEIPLCHEDAVGWRRLDVNFFDFRS